MLRGYEFSLNNPVLSYEQTSKKPILYKLCIE
nr:MAG TPA: hypothetical protein [Caudoviricetes sp.]